MGVTVRLHSFLNEGVETQLQVDACTTGDCIKEVVRRFPGAEKKMFAKPGQLKGYIEVLVNGKTAYPNELTAPVANGDVVSLLVLLAGG
ncbi:MAG: MoaD/ThiS family protein [Deltaproteobacteria bacterium]|nr:MoaD/ThiS family protein [Deltaproteobacteria bacterium]